MSSYDPDPILLSHKYDTVLLSQRDLSYTVPVNFLTSPGVSISAACFGHLRYDDNSLGRCFSNLLAVGFRRFEVDVYWDQGRQIWSFCPVAIPMSTDSSLSSSTTLSSSTGLQSSRTSSPSITSATLRPRQLTTASPLANATSIRLINSTGTSAFLSSTGISPASSQTFVSIGPYSCTTSISLSILTAQLLDYIVKTENTLQANLLLFVINIHAAASANSPLLPAAAPTILPTATNLIGNIFWNNLSAFVYTPQNLESDRANLNNSFFKVSERYRPTLEYYDISSDSNGIFSTEDGWPSESFIELGNGKGKRLLLQFGNADPQMRNYNSTTDQGVLFPKGYIQDDHNTTYDSSDGDVIHGCYFDPTGNGASISNQNSSWATNAQITGFSYPTTPDADLEPTLNLTVNITNCGISSILNVTLLNATADQNFIPYSNFSYSSVWSWAEGEPKNYTSDSTVTESLYRCAASSAIDGRLRVQDCSMRNFAACRASPYNWTISSSQSSFSFASSACDTDYLFAAPLTALENSYLTLAIRNTNQDVTQGVWVDFNSLAVQGCWVTGGVFASCPYAVDVVSTDRTILVPTVAAIIVLVLSALTVFSKAAGNRKVRKRTRRRVVNGFVYEGVPS